MTLREDIFAALTSGTPNILRVYPDALPQKAILPAVTFFTVAGKNDFHLQGQSGLVTRIVQIDAWAGTALSADNIMATVEELMVASSDFQVNAIDVSGADPYEQETERYRASREFTLWIQQ